MRYVAALLTDTAMAAVVLCIRGADSKIDYVDAFGVAGAVSLLLSLLLWAARAGAFDTIGYGLSSIVSGRKYADLYEYVGRKRELRGRRRSLIAPFFAAGVLFLVISFLIF